MSAIGESRHHCEYSPVGRSRFAFALLSVGALLDTSFFARTTFSLVRTFLALRCVFVHCLFPISRSANFAVRASASLVWAGSRRTNPDSFPNHLSARVDVCRCGNSSCEGRMEIQARLSDQPLVYSKLGVLIGFVRKCC